MIGSVAGIFNRVANYRDVRECGPMMDSPMAVEGIEISPRFRRVLEERIARLEQGAAFDEVQLARLKDEDHVRRQRKLVAIERSEALRMRLFLDRAGTRLPSPLFEVENYPMKRVD